MRSLFRAEEQRDSFAKLGKYKEFRSSYFKLFVPLKDFNNAKFWDKKNLGERGKLTSSPIYGDKIRKIVKIIQKSRGNLLDVGLGTGEIERILDNSRLNLFGIDD